MTRYLPLLKIMFLGFIFMVLMSPGVKAQEITQGIKEPKKKVELKTVKGEVSGISYNFIAILYGQDEKTSYEMAVALDKDTKWLHKNSFKEINVGDIVSVKYEEVTEVDESNVSRTKARVAKLVTFVSTAPRPPDTEPAVSKQEEPQQEELEQEEQPAEEELKDISQEDQEDKEPEQTIDVLEQGE